MEHSVPQDLLRRCVEGDQLASARFWNEVHGWAVEWCRRKCGGMSRTRREDLAVFMTEEALLSLKGFDGRSSFFTWLTTLCRRLVFDAARDATRRARIAALAAAIRAGAGLQDAPDAAITVLCEALRSAIRQCRRKVTAEQAKVAYHRLIRLESNAETSRLLDMSEDATSHALGRAMSKIRPFLKTFPAIREYVSSWEKHLA